MSKPLRHILVTGGIYHDFAATAAALAKAIESMGVQTTIVLGADAVLSNVDVSNCDLLTIDALLFTMTQHEKYAPLREQYAFELSAPARETASSVTCAKADRCSGFTRRVFASMAGRNGPGFSGPVGCGVDRLIRPRAMFEVERMIEGDDIVTDAPPFEVFDEVYRGLQVAPEAEPLLQARAEGDGESHPVMWRYRYGAGRVIYDALGHGPDSMTEPTHLGILKRAVQWLLEPAMTKQI